MGLSRHVGEGARGAADPAPSVPGDRQRAFPDFFLVKKIPEKRKYFINYRH